MKAELLQGFYLGDLLVEPLKGQVVGRAGTAHLPPKAVEVLLCLACNPGELVTRDKLLDDVWGDGLGSQEALSHAVSEIRHALDDHIDNPRFIQTLPKRGYRLIIAPVLAEDFTGSIIIGGPGGAHAADIGFLQNLNRRGVLETGLAYLIVGWLLIQIADIVFGQLLLPPIVGTFVTVLVILGFPIAIVMSWYLEFRDGQAFFDSASPVDARRRRFSRTYMSVIGALLVAAVLVLIYDQNIGLPEPDDVVEPIILEADLPPVLENSLAVLPFVNVDGSDETQIFANGLVDDLITSMSHVPGLLVASRGDAFELEPNSASAEVRRRLRVATYLEGSVQIASGQIRVIVQLIDSASGFHILSRTFDPRPRNDFFEIRDEITSLTVASVRVAVPTGTDTGVLQASDTPDLDAYVLYRQGVEASREPVSPDSVARALQWFNSALDVDPDYAAAHAGLCDVYVLAYVEIDDEAYISNAEESCAAALNLNPNLDVVHTSLGQLFTSTGQYEEAETSYNRALEIVPTNVSAMMGLGETLHRLNRSDEAEASFRQAVDAGPGNWEAYNSLGRFLFRSGRFEDAAKEYAKVVAVDRDNIAGYSNLGTSHMMAGDFAAATPVFEQALEVEPKKTTFSNLGLMYYFQGEFGRAIESHRRAIEMEPNDHLAWSNLGDALFAADDMDESRTAFASAQGFAKNALDVNPNDAFALMDLAWIEAMLNNRGEARNLMSRALELAPDDPYTHYYDALVRLRADDPDASLEALERAVALGYSIKLLAAEPHFSSLRTNPRFRTLVQES